MSANLYPLALVVLGGSVAGGCRPNLVRPNLVRLVGSLRVLDECTTVPSVDRVPVPSDAGTDASGDRLYRVACANGQPGVLVTCDANNNHCSAPPGATR